MIKFLGLAIALTNLPLHAEFHILENKSSGKIRVEIQLTKSPKGLIIDAGKTKQMELEGECTKRIKVKGLEGEIQGKTAESNFNPPCMLAKITFTENPPGSLQINIDKK